MYDHRAEAGNKHCTRAAPVATAECKQLLSEWKRKKKTCKNLSAPAIKALFRLLQIVATAADQSSTGAVPLDDGRPHAIGPLIFGEAGQTVTSRFISLHFLVAAAHGRRPFVSGETLLSSAASNSRPFLCRGLTPNLFQNRKTSQK